jgi:hypothetical protein
MIDNCLVVLQNCVDLLKVSCSDTCLTSSHDGNQVIDIKVEDVTDIQEQEDLLLTDFPAVETEHEVSCMSVCTLLDTFHRYTEFPVFFSGVAGFT